LILPGRPGGRAYPAHHVEGPLRHSRRTSATIVIDPALLLMQEGVPMITVDLSTSKRDGLTVAPLRGEFDVADAAKGATELAAVVTREHARHAGGDLLLAGPQRQVLRVLAVTRLIEVFSVHGCVSEAAICAGKLQIPAPAAAHPFLLPAI
jgi:hypothetical protein